MRSTFETWLSIVFTDTLQARGDLLVHVAAGDQLEYLALSRGELVELGVAADALAAAKRVEDESIQPWREDGIPRSDALDRDGQILREIVFVTYPRALALMTAITSSGRVGNREREEAHSRPVRGDGGDDRVAAPVREVDVEEDDVRDPAA